MGCDHCCHGLMQGTAMLLCAISSRERVLRVRGWFLWSFCAEQQRCEAWLPAWGGTTGDFKPSPKHSGVFSCEACPLAPGGIMRLPEWLCPADPCLLRPHRGCLNMRGVCW